MKRLACTLALALAATTALAQIRMDDPWVGATAAGQQETAAFLQLTSAEDLKLVGVRTPVAGRAEIQKMVKQDAQPKMRAVPSVALPAGKPVALNSGDLHVMLFDLKRPLKVGDIVPLTLLLERGDGATGSMDLKVQVRPAVAGHQHGHAHDY